MWSSPPRDRTGTDRSGAHLLRRLLWLAPAVLLLIAGTQAARPVFAAPLTVSITGPNAVATGTSATFVATVTGQQGGCTSTSNTTYTWFFSDGNNSNIPSGPTVTHTFTQAGIVTVGVLVQDNCGDTAATQSLQVVVGGNGGTTGSCTSTQGNPITVTPTASATTINANTQVTFFAAVSGAAGAVTYNWNFGDNSFGNTNPVNHTYTNGGTYTVTLTATDNLGRIGCGTTTVTVQGGTGTGTGSQTCNASVRVAPNGPYTGNVNQPVSFGGFAQTFNSGATISNYTWNFGDNMTGTGQSPSHTYTAAGTYTVTLTATDSIGQSCSATTTATIGGSSSGGSVGTGTATQNGVTVSTGGPYTGNAGSPITFNATSSTTNQNARIVSCVWVFGDQNSSAPCAGATHTYNSNGTYTAAVTVTDSTGALAEASTTVTIGGGGSSNAGGSRSVSLVSGCNNITSTFPDGTPTGTLVSGISPQASLLSVWKLADPAKGRYSGYFPGATQASDLQTLNRLDAVFVCVNGAATLTEPGV